MEIRRGFPRWKILLAVFGSMALVIGGLAFRVWWAAEKRWAEMRSGMLKLLHEELARPTERPVLRGTPESGNAWDDYEQALARIGRMSSSDRSLLDFSANRDFPNAPRLPRRAKLESILAPLEPAVTHLRKGAGRGRAQFHSRDVNGVEIRPLKGFLASGLGHLVALRARFLAEDGKATETADLLLDFGQFVRDFSQAEHRLVKYAWSDLEEVFLEELCVLVRSGKLTPETLLRVDRELELLERSSRSFGPIDPPDLLRLGFRFLRSDNLFREIRGRADDEERIPAWGAWRFGLSDRLMVADAVAEGSDWLRTCDSLRSASWAEIQRAQADFELRVSRSPNPVVRSDLRLAGNWMPITRMQHARLRLLRIAAVHRATGEFLELEDPFGGTLRRAEIGCRYKVWSVGRDGSDDGGDGDWKQRSTNIKDIVLEIER